MDDHRILDEAALSGRYRAPSARAAGKIRDRLDAASVRFIGRSPFLVLATSDGRTVDASPRGGPPGFVRVLDDRHVAVPDLSGNNLLDSFRNVVANPWAGLLFVVPGKDETLRINGPAHLSVEPELLGGFTPELRRPKMALVVETAEVYGHCAKAFRRARLWDPASWEALADAPDLAAIYAAQRPDVDEDRMRADLAELYVAELAEDRPDGPER